VDTLASLLTSGGLEVSVSPTIRDAVWTKLVSNLVGGSLGVLTASATKDVLDKPTCARTAKAMVDEVAAVARALGCDAGDTDESVRKLATSSHLQSIVQDLQGGRPMEIDALFRVPLDLAKLAQVPTPHLDLVVELATQRARAAGQYYDS
jgi:2-dehydropantoate 2-reductase